MSADALPYTLLIILAEFTIGGSWVLWLAARYLMRPPKEETIWPAQ